jgi:hypothetical protein
MEVELNDAEFKLNSLRSERKDLKHKLRVHNLVSNVRHQFDPGVFELSIWQEHSKPSSVVGVQTTMTNQDYEYIIQQLMDNQKLLESREAVKAEMATISKSLAGNNKELSQFRIELARMKENADTLELQCKIALRDALHPATIRRAEMEKILQQKHVDLNNLHSHGQECRDEIKQLVCRIEDLKCVHGMLQKKIAEARNFQRPNVSKLLKDLSGLKDREKATKQKVKILQMEESLFSREANANKGDDTRLQVLKNKLGQIQRNPDKPGILMDIQMMEEMDEKLNEVIIERNRTREGLRQKIVQISRVLNTQRIEVPEWI